MTNAEGEEQKDTFLNNLMRAFLIVLLTIGLIYIRNQLAGIDYFKKHMWLAYFIFCFIVIIFMFIMTGIQGSSFMSLITLIIILASITMIIWNAAGAGTKTS